MSGISAILPDNNTQPMVYTELESYREEITKIDQQIIHFLHDRFFMHQISVEVSGEGQLQYIKNLEHLAMSQGLNTEFITPIWQKLFQWMKGIYDRDIDLQLVKLLHDRFLVVEKVGIFKESIGMPPMQEAQWQKVVKTRREWAREVGLDEIWTENFLDAIHEYSLIIEDGCKKPDHLSGCSCIACKPASVKIHSILG